MFPDSFPAPPLAWVHAFAKQGAALSALPLRARTPPTRAACPCACCDESQPARPGILQPSGTRASLQQTSASATTPSRAMTLPALSRNEQPHWTGPNLQPWHERPTRIPKLRTDLQSRFVACSFYPLKSAIHELAIWPGPLLAVLSAINNDCAFVQKIVVTLQLGEAELRSRIASKTSTQN
jgi:hypothetical protein